MAKLSEQIEDLIEKGADFSESSLTEIMSWKEDAMKVDALQDLKSHEGLKLLLEDIKVSIKIINNAFQSPDGELLNKKGRALLEKRLWFEEFMGVFSFADAQKEQIEKDIKDNQINE